jgi:hypothetical protein
MLHGWTARYVVPQISPSLKLIERPLAVYAILTQIPALFILYDSPFWSGAFLLFIFSVSVWNGGGYYIEVFGRKYVHLNRLSSSAAFLSLTPLFADSNVS